MKDYVVIVKLMFNLITKFEWGEEVGLSFKNLKRLLASAPILRLPDWDVIFHVHTYAFDFAIGSISI